MWDFPLVNIAAAKVVNGGNIERIRIVVNGVAAHPWRLKQVEDAITGKPANEATAEMAGKMAIQGAVPLRYNGYKLPLMRNLVKRAIRGRHEGGHGEPHSVGNKSLGPASPDPYRVGPDLGGGDRGLAVSGRPRHLCRLFRQARENFSGTRLRSPPLPRDSRGD